MKQLRFVWLTLCTGLLSIAVVAQTADCPALVQTALDSVDATCAETGRNQACYGNVSIDLQAQADATVESFEAPGDTIDLGDVATMSLAPLDEVAQTWGVALMKVQANVPDTLPGQNVTFLLFGDVVIENAADDESGFTPMQAFYFRSGVGDAGCEEAPESGLMIQTPEGVEEVLLNVNGANMSLGSTAFLQAGPIDADDDEFELAISVLEGEGTIEAFGEVQPIPAGSWVRVPVDRNFNITGAPNLPRPYQNERHGQLPIRALERQFDPIESLTEDEIERRLQSFDPEQARDRLQTMGANLNEQRLRENFRGRLNPDDQPPRGDPSGNEPQSPVSEGTPPADRDDQSPPPEGSPPADRDGQSPPPEGRQRMGDNPRPPVDDETDGESSQRDGRNQESGDRP